MAAPIVFASFSFARSLVLPVSCLLVAVAGSPGKAQEWSRQDGPFGGTVVALDRTGSGSVFALRSDTVFRTMDGGAHWTNVGPTALAFTFLAIDVTESGAIWTGTSTRGVAWSLNGGATWTNDQIVTNPHSGLGASIIAIGVDPAGRILAGAYRSVNQGGSFVPMSISGTCFAFDASRHALAGTTEGVWRVRKYAVSEDGSAAGIRRRGGPHLRFRSGAASPVCADIVGLRRHPGLREGGPVQPRPDRREEGLGVE